MCCLVRKNGFVPKYQTAYACEGKKLTIECDPGDLINLIRANYGRFSITICNDHGNVEWSVNCMFPKSLTVLNSRCAHKQSCSVLATTSMFGDPCPGTHKYLEAHYQCISAAQTSTTTNRPSPPWVLTNTPPHLATNGSAIINPAGAGVVASSPPLQSAAGAPPRLPLPGGISAGGAAWNALPSSPGPPTPPHTTLPGGRLKGGYNSTAIKNGNRHDGLPPPPPLQQHHHHHTNHHVGGVAVNNSSSKSNATPTSSNTTASPNTRILTGVGGSGSDDGTLLTTKTAQNRGNNQQPQQPSASNAGSGGSSTTTATGGSGANDAADFSGMGAAGGVVRTINNINNLNAGLAGSEDDANMFCGPTNARNLFWNVTRVGDVNVQPCPGGATGIAKWRCVLMKRVTDINIDDDINATESPASVKANMADCLTNSSNCETPLMLANKVNQRIRNFEPTWHPMTPDLTQCRSLWLNSLEVRVNQRDSSLISIANDLSEVTSSKTLYGGDMLVTTKIIQTMSEKMFHDKETFPDQRQREAIILELLHGVVKTGSNLLDESQLSSWLDLNQEDQMRVATSLLTGLEYNAFLLADTIIRERNVVQKVKNILLSVRVLETKNIQSNEVFPDAEQWQISDDHIELPRAALIENSEGGLVRIVFAAFDRLESILKPSYDHFDMKSARSYVRNTAILTNDSSDAAGVQQQQRIRILNSKVISASLGKGRHIQLSQPIKLVLRHLKTENVTNPTCVFWNYIDHAWSANGCNLESTNRTHSVCMCNHLTNFAILMDVMDEHNHSLFTMFDGNMRILIYISISICLLFIIIALLTLKIFNGVFIKSARTSIYRSIYVCLLFIEVLFLFGIEQNETNTLCGFTTIFLHCSILSAIAWFCFEAFQSYSTLTTDDMLLEVDQTSKVNCYYLLSYALSFTIVAISLAINPSTYTQNDFCVLMEANILFYATFVTPVTIFFVGALGYTFLSWIVMCRKSRTTLKNKEHTRLANVRFDIRCSFIFLLILSAVWISAYYYLRRAKIDDDVALIFGYLFVSFNTLMGFYIFAFHCIQNEKIRREYRKYVRQNSWLPKCLRCSKTSISSGIVGGSGVGTSGGCASGAGTISSNIAGSSSTQMKKTKLPVGVGNDIDETGGIISASEDAIMASSDCELNEAQIRRTVGGITEVGGTIKSGIMPGNLVLQHGKANSIIDSMQGHIVLERGGGGVILPGTSGTLRSTGGGGAHTPSAGHTSPTSSAGSTHLIFGHHKQQQQQVAVGSSGAEAFYHHPDYYSWKQQGGGAKCGAAGVVVGGNGIPLAAAATAGYPRDYRGNGSSPQPAHEFFYWTQKHNQHGKKKRSSAIGPDSPSGSLHSRTTAASQILFYPSYKKTTLKQQQQYQQQYPHYAEAIEPPTAAAYYQQQQQQQQQNRRHPTAAVIASQHHHHPHMQQQQYLQQQQQQQQLSSDDEQMESAAHAHLLHLSRRGGPQLPPPPLLTTLHQYPSTTEDRFGGPSHAPTQRYYRHKHSNCDLNQDYEVDRGGGGGASECYYNQNSLGGDGPVYEEILSNRNSGVQHYNVGDDDDGDEDEAYECDKNGRGRVGGGSRGGFVGVGGTVGARRARARGDAADCSSEDDDNDGDDDDDETQHGLPPQSDERMRRLMAMQDEDFKRRFQRQQRKNGLNEPAPAGYHDYDTQLQQQHPHPQNAVFGVSGGGSGSGGGGSVRSFKKISPNSRLAVNELFNHGPPLPPANQYPMQKRQQQQHQQLSPQSITAAAVTVTAATTSSSHPLQQPIGRNISAMLDENNTVRCYLEPLTK